MVEVMMRPDHLRRALAGHELVRLLHHLVHARVAASTAATSPYFLRMSLTTMVEGMAASLEQPDNPSVAAEATVIRAH